MAIDDDLSALLPKPPPPRPARREAAIAEAMRRFDVAGEGASPPPVGAAPKPASAGWSRPQIAALASVALVLAVSLPIWLTQKDRWAGQEAETTAAAPQGSLAVDIEPARRPPEPSAEPAASPASPGAPARLAEASAAKASAAKASPSPVAVAAAPPPAPAAPAAPAEAAEQPSASRAPELARLAPTETAAPRAAGDNIIVTGARVAGRDSNAQVRSLAEASSRPGDWTACTVLDPREDLSACRGLADPAANGAAGRAAARLSDGLALAWQGETGRALDAFDRAIAEDPDLSIAYLNRGLVRRSLGDLRRALADLNRAVARDPASARNYYHRSLLHSERGAAARAAADAKRAIALDPRYRTVLPSE